MRARRWPPGVASCRTPADVALCLSFVRRFGMPVAARSGGHSYAGWSVTSGLVVDVTEMNSFRLGPGGRSVTVGTGLHLIDFYHRLAGHGLAVPAGSCPTVGVAGLTLGGGVGVLGRAYGLTCDNLEAVQVVTADGSILDADASHHGDLYWACRGGGGGNFGVATSMTFRTHRLARLVLFFLSWPWPQAARVVDGWQSWAPHAPDALWSNLHLSAAPGGPAPTLQVGGTYLGGTAGLAALLDRLYARVGSAPQNPFVQEASFLDAMLVDAGCSGLTVDECHLPWQAPSGRLARVPSDAKSDFFTAALPRAGIRTLLTGVERLRGVRGASGGAGGIAFDAFGGALNRVPAAATAFVHRDTLFLAQYTTEWPDGAAVRAVAGQRAWLRRFTRPAGGEEITGMAPGRGQAGAREGALRPGAGVPVPAGGRPRAVTRQAGLAADQRAQREQGDHHQGHRPQAGAVPHPAGGRHPALEQLDVGMGAAGGPGIPANEDPDDTDDDRHTGYGAPHWPAPSPGIGSAPASW